MPNETRTFLSCPPVLFQKVQRQMSEDMDRLEKNIYTRRHYIGVEKCWGEGGRGMRRWPDTRGEGGAVTAVEMRRRVEMLGVCAATASRPPSSVRLLLPMEWPQPMPMSVPLFHLPVCLSVPHALPLTPCHCLPCLSCHAMSPLPAAHVKLHAKLAGGGSSPSVCLHLHLTPYPPECSKFFLLFSSFFLFSMHARHGQFVFIFLC